MSKDIPQEAEDMEINGHEEEEMEIMEQDQEAALLRLLRLRLGSTTVTPSPTTIPPFTTTPGSDSEDQVIVDDPSSTSGSNKRKASTLRDTDLQPKNKRFLSQRASFKEPIIMETRERTTLKESDPLVGLINESIPSPLPSSLIISLPESLSRNTILPVVDLVSSSPNALLPPCAPTLPRSSPNAITRTRTGTGTQENPSQEILAEMKESEDKGQNKHKITVNRNGENITVRYICPCRILYAAKFTLDDYDEYDVSYCCCGRPESH